jgi:hypothetical protein
VKQRSVITTLTLIVYNLLPIAGVIFWDWSLFTVLVLYWLESGVIGIFNLFRIAMAQGPLSGSFKINGQPPGPNGKLFVLFFFPVHYGIFWIVHGFFVFMFFGMGFLLGVQTGGIDGFAGFDLRGVGLAAVSMVISHAVTFLFVFVGNREYLETSPDRQMMQPYSRVFVLHGTILGGAWVITQAGTPMAALALLIALKMAIDLFIHFRTTHTPESVPATPAEQRPSVR